jgi:hypothetical protein
MSKVVFGQNYNLIGSDEHRSFVGDIGRNNVRISVLYNASSIKSLRLDKWLFPEAMKARKGFLKYISFFLNPKEGQTTDKKGSIFSRLKAAHDPETGKQLNGVELRAETATLIAAGKKMKSSSFEACINFGTIFRNGYNFDGISISSLLSLQFH